MEVPPFWMSPQHSLPLPPCLSFSVIGIKKILQKRAWASCTSTLAAENHLSSLFVNELGDLADGDGLTLVTEGESTESRVLGESLDTDTGTVVAGNLQTSDNAHTLGGETGSLL